MTITREQVADLQPGDIVMFCYDGWPEGTFIQGPLTGDEGAALFVAGHCVRYGASQPLDSEGVALTVLARKSRWVYVNHPRTEFVPGDVVRDADSDDVQSWSYADYEYLGERCWRNTRGSGGRRRREDLPARLRLLVDGETGQAAP